MKLEKGGFREDLNTGTRLDLDLCSRKRQSYIKKKVLGVFEVLSVTPDLVY